MSQIRCALFYDRQLDRLIGGDFFRDLQGRPIKSSLMARERAISLVEATRELVTAYTERFGVDESGNVPLPQVVAVLAPEGFPAELDGQQQMVAIDDLFTLDQLADAPEEYKELGQLLALVPTEETLSERPPDTAEECSAIAVQLFKIIGCGHRLPATFTRGAGSSLRPDSVTATGGLNDVYYLTPAASGGDPSRDLHTSQRDDLLHAFATLSEAAAAISAPLEDVFMSAVEGYMGRAPVPAALTGSIREVALGLSASRSTAVSIASLADAILDAPGEP
jgi:hypothetical protein